MSDLLLLGADGDSAVAFGSYGQHIGIGQTGSKRLPWLPNLRQLWLPRLLGADGDSGPHPQQYPPGLQLPKAGFNVGPDRTQQDQPSLEHFVSLGQTGSERLPWLATLRHRWLPRASFNVVSAASGGRWGFCGCHCSRT